MTFKQAFIDLLTFKARHLSGVWPCVGVWVCIIAIPTLITFLSYKVNKHYQNKNLTVKTLSK